MKIKGLAVAIALVLSMGAVGQNVISAKAGLIQYVEGKVLLDGAPVEVSMTNFPEVKDNQVLQTEEGRAEVLLGPGSFVRMGENSGIRMVSRSLADVRLAVTGGSVLLEVSELPKDSNLSISFLDRTVSFRKNGLFRFDSNPSIFRVYDGEAVIGNGKESLTVKKGRQVALDSTVMVADKFDPKVGDELYRWAAHRAAYTAMANVASAKTIVDRGTVWGTSGWYFNPYYGMFTYVPYRGSYMSPFGYSFWSPGMVGYALYPSYYGGGGGHGYSGGGSGGTHYDPNLGYNVGGRSAGYNSSVNYGGSSSSSVSTGSVSAASTGSSRGGSDAGGRGSSSGGGRGH